MEKRSWIDDDDQTATPSTHSIPYFHVHATEDRKEMRPILRYILSNPLKLPSSPFKRHTYQELEEAACRRNLDLENIINILKSPENIRALDAAWMYDFINTEGNNLNSLAKLLVDEKYDSPWILRPDYFDTLSSTFKRLKLGDFSQSIDFVREYVPKDEMEYEEFRSEYSVDNKPSLKPDLMLGLAGFLPVARGGLKDDMLHESWLEDVQRHITLEKNEAVTVSVVYGKRCLPGSPGETYLLARQTQASLAVLIHVIKELRDLKMIPAKSLPILMKGPLINTIEVVDMYFSDFTALWESMALLVRDLEVEIPDAQETALKADTFPQDRELVIKHHNLFYNISVIIVSIMSLIYTMCFKSISRRNFTRVENKIEHTPNTDSRNEFHLRGERKEKIAPNEVDHEESYIDGQSNFRTPTLNQPPINQVKDVLKLIFTRIKNGNLIASIADKEPGPAPYSLNALRAKHQLLSILIRTIMDNHDQDAPSVESEVIHYAALSVQIMSLGLQAYAQAHTGDLEFSFIDRGVSKVLLKGGGLNSKVATAELHELTCFGNVTKSSVMVFNIDDLENVSLSNELNNAPCDIISSLDNIARIWGGPRLNYWDDLVHPPLTYQKGVFWIGNGILYPTSHTEINYCLWHWLSETDPQFSQILSDTERLFSSLPMQTHFPVRIGAIRINKLCPGSSDDGHQLSRYMARDHLNNLEAFAPHWELTNFQSGIQGGQWIIPQIMLGWQKLPGRTKKQAMLDPANSLLIPELNKVWGIQLSICTGVLRRVPLQQLIATCVESYMAGRLPPLPEWATLREKLRMVDALSKPGLGSWFRNLPLNYQTPASMIIKEVLNKLQHTGVDEHDNLRVGWADPNDGFQCLTIPCRRPNSWARMLIDSTEVATFACVTNLCLETCGESRAESFRGPNRACRGTISFDPRPSLQLATQVRPRGVDYHSRTTAQNWSLEKGKSYWMGREDLMLMATVDVDSGETMLRIKRSTMPVKLFRRMNSRATVRETNDAGAVNCLVISDGS